MIEKLRAFIAIELDQEIKSVIDTFENEVKPKAPSGLRWVKPDQLHLTLKFLGDITPSQAADISASISRVASENHSLILQVTNTGAFPNWRNPRTLWLGLNKSDALSALFQQLDAEMARFGFSPEGKPFTPHLTICRVSDYVDPRSVQPLEIEFTKLTATTLPAWKVSELVFFKSQLRPGGPIYTAISRHGLE